MCFIFETQVHMTHCRITDSGISDMLELARVPLRSVYENPKRFHDKYICKIYSLP